MEATVIYFSASWPGLLKRRGELNKIVLQRLSRRGVPCLIARFCGQLHQGGSTSVEVVGVNYGPDPPSDSVRRSDQLQRETNEVFRV